MPALTKEAPMEYSAKSTASYDLVFTSGNNSGVYVSGTVTVKDSKVHYVVEDKEVTRQQFSRWMEVWVLTWAAKAKTK